MKIVEEISNFFEKNKLMISLFLFLMLVLLICILKKFINFSNIEGATSMAEKQASAEGSINNNSKGDKDSESAEDAGCGEGDGCDEMDTEAAPSKKKYI